jgi:hypothetical protein
MRVAFVIREAMPEGGLSLSAFRLATALAEAGHDAEVLYGGGEPPPGMAAAGRLVPADTPDGVSPGLMRRELERADPSVVLVGSGRVSDLDAAATVAPTALHAHLHMGVCPDNNRYWSRLGRPCGVRAGWRCAVLRPALGCSDMKRALDPAHIATQGRILERLAAGGIGAVCVGTDQAELYARHGVPASRIAVLPNLGMRASAAELAELSASTPEPWRDATAFIGRLSKEKGGSLLGKLSGSLPPGTPFRVFGEGYLAPRLGSLLGDALCGHVGQGSVIGVLMWARALAFPSLWPEPGGIAGVDAQVMGVPLAAFDVGVARFWPAAQRFPRGDVGAMAAWLAGLAKRSLPRDPDAVAAAQHAYWQRIGDRAAEALDGFAREGRFAPLGAPAERLIGEPRGVPA